MTLSNRVVKPFIHRGGRHGTMVGDAGALADQKATPILYHVRGRHTPSTQGANNHARERGKVGKLNNEAKPSQ